MTLGKSLIAALAAGAISATPASAVQAPPQQENGVTLITSDRVVVTGQGHQVKPGPGRQVDFTTQVLGGHLYVIPADAAPLIAQGVLDRRLFDITQLLAWKYGDADTPDIPVISQGISGQAIAPQGAQRVRQLSGLGMSVVRVPKASAARTWKELTGARTLTAGQAKLWLDGRRTFSLDESVKQIGAPQAWQQGITGKGVTVAVLDSGYDPDHPDLKDAVAQERNFSDDPDIRDTIGHGTHVASIVAGRDGKYRGVAPEATLAIGKVGGAAGPTDSAILAGMEWAATEVKAKVVNMSFGDTDGPDLDPLEQAVNTLSERTGTLFVAAAGNGGADDRVLSPGSADAALTVGAVDKKGQLAVFSSPGPRVSDHAIKPDVTAPGVDITAAAVGGGYRVMSGTSMASPHVAGAAAILAQRHPDWTGAQLKAALIGSAAPAQGPTLYQQGAGLIDLVRALKQQVVAEQGNVWAPFPWNAAGKRVTTKTITYANASDAPVTLDLSAQGEVLKLPTDQVTVPAKGEASVTLTIDATGKAPGDYPGTVTASAGDTVVRTLAGAYVEPESYDVTLTVIGKQGQPINPRQSQIYDAKTGTIHQPAFRNGVAKVRLPEGEWNFYTETLEKIDGNWLTTIADPALKIDGGDQQLTVDARQGKAAKITLDDPSAELQRGYALGLTHGAWNSWWSTNGNVNTEFFVVPSRRPGLTYGLETTWLSKDASPSPYVYQLVDRRTDGFPEDPVYDARQQDLAKVTATYRASGVAATGAPLSGLRDPDFPGSALSSLVGDITLPGTLISYRTPGLTFESGLEVGTSLMFDGGRPAKRGQTSEVWNAAVTGPSFLLPGGNRTGDKLTFSGVGLFADGGANRTGSDTAATGSATLAKDGQVLATADLAGCWIYEQEGCQLRADLPAGRGSYTLTASMRRPATLSTEVNTAWTFPSATTAKEQPLPLTAVRYSPQGLDTSNRAKPGSVTSLPVRIERNPGAAKAETKSIRLEMSADDGKSWRSVPVTRTESGWTAGVPNPRTAGFVSLRAVVTDTAGNGVTQTITRAYAVG
ncbi:S8 family peptidase [Nonomuraea guangzhouensis]|uniref:S8 family serine peptidase n=1 Tax=Nonomuraea guangzhouensis TaxID=1291555 RepID=A0ABW4GA60_9ACTN|nr:S8 family serine peptidase [Nonomuraea guangzhouensis]